MVRFQRRWEQDQQSAPFRRLRDKRWNPRAIWRYAFLLVLLAVIYKLLQTI